MEAEWTNPQLIERYRRTRSAETNEEKAWKLYSQNVKRQWGRKKWRGGKDSRKTERALTKSRLSSRHEKAKPIENEHLSGPSTN